MVKCLLIMADQDDRMVWMDRVPCKGEIVRVGQYEYGVSAIRWESFSTRMESDPYDWGVEVVPMQLAEYMAHVYLGK